MAVIIGSARIDENGKAHGGAAGDHRAKRCVWRREIFDA